MNLSLPSLNSQHSNSARLMVKFQWIFVNWINEVSCFLLPWGYIQRCQNVVLKKKKITKCKNVKLLRNPCLQTSITDYWIMKKAAADIGALRWEQKSAALLEPIKDCGKQCAARSPKRSLKLPGAPLQRATSRLWPLWSPLTFDSLSSDATFL